MYLCLCMVLVRVDLHTGNITPQFCKTILGLKIVVLNSEEDEEEEELYIIKHIIMKQNLDINQVIKHKNIIS